MLYNRNIQPISDEAMSAAIQAIEDDMDIGQLTDDDSESERPRKKRKGNRKQNFTEDGKPTKLMLRKIDHEFERMCKDALSNRRKSRRLIICVLLTSLVVLVQTYDFRKKIRGKKQPIPQQEVIIIDDDQPRSIWSNDNVLLAVYLPNAVKDKGKVWACDVIIQRMF
jgi:hypothetical protein